VALSRKESDVSGVSVLEAAELAVCNVQNRPAYWDGCYGPTSHFSAAFQAVRALVKPAKSTITELSNQLGLKDRVGFKLFGKQPATLTNYSKYELFRVLSDAIDALLSRHNEPATSRRIRRFLLGDASADSFPEAVVGEHSFFMPKWRDCGLPARFCEIASFYRSARALGSDHLSSIINVAGYTPFNGGDKHTLRDIRREVENAAHAGVSVYYVFPDDSSSRRGRFGECIGEIRRWAINRKVPNLHLIALKPALAEGHQQVHSWSYFCRPWRYSAILTGSGAEASQSIRMFGVRTDLETLAQERGPTVLHEGYVPSSGEVSAFLEWVRKFVLVSAKEEGGGEGAMELGV